MHSSLSFFSPIVTLVSFRFDIIFGFPFASILGHALLLMHYWYVDDSNYCFGFGNLKLAFRFFSIWSCLVFTWSAWLPEIG